MAFKRKFSSKKRKTSRRFVKRVSKKRSGLRSRALVRTIKRVALSATETKHAYRCQENIQLYHNAGYIYNGVLYTQTGVTDSGFDAETSYASRVGDEIMVKGIDFRFWLSNKSDRPNVQYRIIIYSYPANQTIGLPELFNSYTIVALTTFNNKMMAYINTDKIQVIKEIRVQSNGGDYSLENGAANKEKSFYRQYFHPMKLQRVKYQDPTSGIPKNRNIGVCVIPYDTYGALTSDNIASLAWSYKLYFKDP